MSPEALELLRLSISFAGGAVGAGVTNTALGKWFERQQRRETARQTRWLPLLDAARTLSNRLDDLQTKYREIPPKCEWMKRGGRS